jgi:triosephosphate isomerase
MTKKLIIANWKMHKTNTEALAFAKQFKNTQSRKAKVIVAAPFTDLATLSVAQKDFQLAAQDVSAYDEGAYTGEISARMLKEVGAEYCIVGHSERRIYHTETDAMVSAKVQALLKKKITPILCFGETREERDSGKTKVIIKKQITKGLQGVDDVSEVILAYEPVWAISTFQKGKKKSSASEGDIAQVHAYIKDLLAKLFGNQGQRTAVVYGGSVHARTCENFIKYDDVDGVLVGRESLTVASFQDIINTVE